MLQNSNDHDEVGNQSDSLLGKQAEKAREGVPDAGCGFMWVAVHPPLPSPSVYVYFEGEETPSPGYIPRPIPRRQAVSPGPCPLARLYPVVTLQRVMTGFEHR